MATALISDHKMAENHELPTVVGDSMENNTPSTNDLLENKEENESTSPPSQPAIEYSGGITLSSVVIALMLAMFLVALDMSIIATAIPRITNEFGSLDQVGWYGSAFFLCLAAFVSFWGKAYKYLPLKSAFLTSIFVFEVGSLVCAVSPSSTALIVGRAIQGMGGAGVTGGCYTIIAFIVRPAKVPAYMGMVEQSSVWRVLPVLFSVVFYINLPIGGATILVLLFFYHSPAHVKPTPSTTKELLLTFDFAGMIIMMASLICFFLALEWSGISKAWSSSDVIGTLFGFVVLAILWAANEWKQKERALVVPHILKQRTIAACAAFILCTNLAGFARVYNLPIYFQAIDGVSPSESGVRVLPTILAISLFTFIGSGAVGKIGYFQPFLIVGSMLATIGGSLIYTFDIGTPSSKFIGYQVVAGTGIGLAIQIPIIVAQATSLRADISIAMSTMLFFQFVAGAIGVSSAQSIFNNRLIANLPVYAPDVTVDQVLAVAAYDLRGAFTDSQLPGVLQCYIIGLRGAWAFSIALSGMTFLISFLVEWKSIKPKQMPTPAGAAIAATTAV